MEAGISAESLTLVRSICDTTPKLGSLLRARGPSSHEPDKDFTYVPHHNFAIGVRNANMLGLRLMMLDTLPKDYRNEGVE